MLRSRLIPLLVVAAIGAAACGVADTTASDQPTVVDGTTEATPTETTSATAEPGGDPAAGEAGDNPAGADSPSPTSPPEAPADDASAEAGADDAAPTPTPDEDTPVVLAFDGRPVPLATVCAGVDGAILATTEGEVTITVVREAGVALRYQAEGTSAETEEVEVDEAADHTVYSATLSSEQVQPLAVTMTVVDDASTTLPSC